MGDDPFADDGDGDDFNPFSDEMFDPSKKTEGATAVPVLDASPANPKRVPDWAAPKESETKSKPEPEGKEPAQDFFQSASNSDVLQAPPAEIQTEAVSLEDDAPKTDVPVPSWAIKKAEKTAETKKKEEKAAKKAAKAKPSQRVKSDLTPSAPPSNNEGDTLLPKDPNYRPNNWPPFPKGCRWPFRACFHHDFKGEIPAWGYKTTRFVYGIWWLNCFALVWNVICLFARLSVNSDATSLEAAFISLILMVCLIPCSYYCWMHSLYTAMRKDSSMRFGCFFFFFFLQMGTAILFAVGFDSVGAMGIINAVDLLHKSKVIGVMSCIAMGLWLLVALLAFISIQKVLIVFRSSGHSVEGIRQEATMEAGKAGYAAARSDAGKQVAKAAWET